MTINAVSRCVRVPRNVDGKLYGTANLGTCGGGTVTRNPAGGTPALNWSAASLSHGSVLQITSDGTYSFGAKTQAAPVHWQFGNEIYVNGVASTEANAWASSGDTIAENAGAARHARVSKGYRALGKGTKQSPAGSNGNAASQKTLYVAYWVKAGSNMASTYIYQTASQNGTFQTNADLTRGEPVTFAKVGGGTVSGYVLKQNASTLSFETVALSGSVTQLAGSTVTGSLSGATATLSSGTTAGTHVSGLGSVKHFRIAHGNYNASEMKTWIGKTWTSGGLLDVDYFNSSGVSQTDPAGTDQASGNPVPLVWTLHEIEADFSGSNGEIVVRLNGNQNLKKSDYSVAYLSATRGMNLASIGVDSPGVGSLSIEDAGIGQDFGEIYIDSTRQRVMIGNASTWSECTHLELQRPTAWETNSISVVINQGGLDSLSGKYLYVIDSNGLPVTSSGVVI